MYTGKKAPTRTENYAHKYRVAHIVQTKLYRVVEHVTKYILAFEKPTFVMQFLSHQIEFMSVASNR